MVKDRLIFLGPLLILPGFVVAWPLLEVLTLSFKTQVVLFDIERWVGFDNFQYLLLEDSRFSQALWNTLYFTGLSVSLEFVLGLAFALYLRFGGGSLWVRVVLLLPWAIPNVVGARLWQWMLDSEAGIVNYALISAGVVSGPIHWLSTPELAIHSAILADVWKTLNLPVPVAGGFKVFPGFVEYALFYGALRQPGIRFGPRLCFVSAVWRRIALGPGCFASALGHTQCRRRQALAVDVGFRGRDRQLCVDIGGCGFRAHSLVVYSGIGHSFRHPGGCLENHAIYDAPVVRGFAWNQPQYCLPRGRLGMDEVFSRRRRPKDYRRTTGFDPGKEKRGLPVEQRVPIGTVA